jgi:hypothetical protein
MSTITDTSKYDCDPKNLSTRYEMVDARTSDEDTGPFPPPPSAYNRNQKKSYCKTETTSPPKEEMRGFLSSQRRYIKNQIYEDELCAHSKVESKSHEAVAIIVLDVVLNGQ